MCRIVVFAIDQRIPQGHKGDNLWKRGDVVEVFEDGRSFGKDIENNPGFRIIEMPGVPVADYQHLVEDEWKAIAVVDEKGNPILDGGGTPISVSVDVRKRKTNLDLSAIELKAETTKGDALVPAEKITMDKADVVPIDKAELVIADEMTQAELADVHKT